MNKLVFAALMAFACTTSRAQMVAVSTDVLMDALQTPSVRNRIWIVTFERKGADGRTITQEVLFRLVCGTLDGRAVILGFGFL